MFEGLKTGKNWMQTWRVFAEPVTYYYVVCTNYVCIITKMLNFNCGGHYLEYCVL